MGENYMKMTGYPSSWKCYVWKKENFTRSQCSSQVLKLFLKLYYLAIQSTISMLQRLVRELQERGNKFQYHTTTGTGLTIQLHSYSVIREKKKKQWDNILNKNSINNTVEIMEKMIKLH